MPWGILGIKNVYDKEEVLNVHPDVVGGGTDGASINIGQHSSIKEEMQKALPWIFWSWCYAHHQGQIQENRKEGVQMHAKRAL